METNGKVGAVKMKPLYALKKMCEEYSIDRVIGGGLVKRYEMVIDKTIKNKEQELENGKNRAEVEIDNSMFGQEVLEELGITKEKLIEALEECNLSPTVRGEALTLEQFAKLSNILNARGTK